MKMHFAYVDTDNVVNGSDILLGLDEVLPFLHRFV
jgi:hypothetical protein